MSGRNVLDTHALATELELLHPRRLGSAARFPIGNLTRKPLSVRFEDVVLRFVDEMRRAGVLTQRFNKFRRVGSA